MQYLPIYPEKSRLETVVPDPMEQQMYKGDWGENLPMYYGIGNDFFNRIRSDNPADYFVAGVEGVGALPTLFVDALGNMGNSVYNGYKRAYNYGANAYNNLADYYNIWQSNRHMNSTPQTSLTGRKITNDMNPSWYMPTLSVEEKPTRYLANNGVPVAKIVDPNPYQVKVTPTSDSKKIIASEMGKLAAQGPIRLNTARAYQLADLYNKVK